MSSASFRIPWSKTTKEAGAAVILTARHDALCPVAALRNHLKVNASVTKEAPLFAYAASGSSWSHLAKPAFLARCYKCWKHHVLYHVLGHSFRIGGAVELLLAGVPPETVAATGGWTSLAFLLYWRRMEEIIPLSTSKAYRQSHLVDLAATFEKFRVACKIPAALIGSYDGSLDDLD